MRGPIIIPNIPRGGTVAATESLLDATYPDQRRHRAVPSCVYSPADRNLATRRDGVATGLLGSGRNGSMHTESGDRRTGTSRRLERAIVLVLLSEDDGARQWSRAELGDGMGVQERELGAALNGLLGAGVLLRDEDRVWPSAAARRLDELELIGG